MIKFVTGDVKTENPYVVPANCVGVMGIGLAEQTKELHPWVLPEYKRLCKYGIKPGKCYLFAKNGVTLIFATTKSHWEDPSKPAWIVSCIEQLLVVAEVLKSETVGVPKLGCGYGGQNWAIVKPAMERILSSSKVLFKIYE